MSLKFLGLLLMSHSPCCFPLYSNLRLFFFLLGHLRFSSLLNLRTVQLIAAVVIAPNGKFWQLSLRQLHVLFKQ